jgi:hypothetical protein
VKHYGTGVAPAEQWSLAEEQEDGMNRETRKFRIVAIAGFALAMTVAVSMPARAQENAQTGSDTTFLPSPEPRPQRADGQRRGLPLETYAVAPGTKFLVRIEDELSTKEMHENQKFKVRTLEPLEHVSHVEPAGVAGRAKIWLTFDEIRTNFGALPIVADVVSVPGDHSIKPGPSEQGTIEGRRSKEKDAAQAAAAGAAIGAVKGVKDKNKKEAAQGAAIGAITAFLEESGRGHDLDLPKGAKLELELGRALYLVRE